MDDITEIKNQLLTQCEQALEEAFSVMKHSESFEPKTKIDIKKDNSTKP